MHLSTESELSLHEIPEDIQPLFPAVKFESHPSECLNDIAINTLKALEFSEHQRLETRDACKLQIPPQTTTADSALRADAGVETVFEVPGSTLYGFKMPLGSRRALNLSISAI